MNLLPPKIQKRRKLYTSLKRMAAIQAVIFLSIMLLVTIFDYFISIRIAQASNLRLSLQDERFAQSQAVVQAIQDHHARQAAEAQIADMLGLTTFSTKKLDILQETIPTGVSLLNIDIDTNGAVLTGYTQNLSLSDIHRQALQDTGLVTEVRLTSAIVTYTGGIRYVISLRWVQ